MFEGVTAGLLLLAAFIATVAGLGWFALAMDVHWAQVRGAATPQPASAVSRLRVQGSLALAVSLGVCLVVDHASMAVLVWAMLLAGAALLIALTLAWRAHWLRWLPA